MSETWTVTEPSGQKKVVSNRKPLPYRPAFEITDKMPKGQMTSAQWFNEMRERLLEIGEMEQE